MGNVTTAVKRDDYLRHCSDIPSDVKYYKLLQNDPTPVIQSGSNILISNLKNKGYITPEKTKSLMCYNSTISKF